jgi:hypothetical protein
MTVPRLVAAVALVFCFVAGYFVALVVETGYKSPRANLRPRRLRERLAKESQGTGRCERGSASRV